MRVSDDPAQALAYTYIHFGSYFIGKSEQCDSISFIEVACRESQAGLCSLPPIMLMNLAYSTYILNTHIHIGKFVKEERHQPYCTPTYTHSGRSWLCDIDVKDEIYLCIYTFQFRIQLLIYYSTYIFYYLSVGCADGLQSSDLYNLELCLFRACP